MALSSEDPTERAWTGTEVAVVGMAGRFPDAPDVDAFWDLLREGREASRTFTRDELLSRGVPVEVVDDPLFVPRGPVLDGIDLFDAPFFGFSPRDAAIMDPQHRLFLECAWEALEHAGYDPARAGGAVGVFAGSGMHAYLIYHLATNPSLMASVGEFLVRHTGNDKDFLPTRVSYEFDLQGPSVGVQTACSTSLVAVHVAIQSLLSGESDVALAGGVSVLLEQENGYVYQPGEILSPDGHCRSFDADAAGTVFGSGVGVVVLKRLADALRDGDTIHGVLLGSAVNNDGRRKVGYLAPSVDGQAAVVAEALAVAGVAPEDISYVEAHGTATPVGDPIEVTALTQAFGTAGGAGTVGLGSVKSNFGHLDTAAGVASLIKTALALTHREIPASLHFRKPHPGLALESGPFYVVDRLTPWEAPSDSPRRAGVSSLGVGGTNAHVVVEEPPAVEAGGVSRPFQLLCISARNDDALDAAAKRLGAHLRAHPEQALADAAHTLHVGRKAFARRRFVVAGPDDGAASLVEASGAGADAPAGGRRVAFLFAGGGAQHPAMARGLYVREPVFRSALDAGLARLIELEGLDLRPHLTEVPRDEAEASAALARPSIGLPALFLVQHALSLQWASWGIRPAALIGHSAGEYAAAVLAGVMSFDDALALVSLRGRLFETLPAGGMVSVALPEPELRARADAAGIDIAAVNGSAMGVVAGPLDALAAFEDDLAKDGLEGSRLHINVAAHSSQVESILAEFGAFLGTITLGAPSIPVASNLTGDWLTAAEATDPEYWVRHLRQTVRFADGLDTLLADDNIAVLEVGPGRTLATLARAHPACKGRPVITSMRHPNEPADDQAAALKALGSLWAAGVEVDWTAFYAGERRRRVPLPTYPFQRQRHWIERGQIVVEAAPSRFAEPGGDGSAATLARRDDVGDWFATTTWRDAPAAAPAPAAVEWLVFDDGSERLEHALEILAGAGARIRRVLPGERFERSASGDFRLRVDDAGDYLDLVRVLAEDGRIPERIVHAWATAVPGQPESFFLSVYHLARALGEHDADVTFHLDLLTQASQRALESDRVTNPAGALLLGPSNVLPSEFEGVTARFVDLDESVNGAALAAELSTRPSDRGATIALRDGRRLGPEVTSTRIEPTGEPWLAAPATCLITGGFGGMGLALARSVAEPGAKIALMGRSAPGAHVVAAIRSMEDAGAQVLALQADVTDEADMARAVAAVRSRFGHIDVVVHAAGVLDDAPVVLKDAHRASAVLAPKVRGVLALAAALADDPPQSLILCSSVSARLGLPGQADYSAANAFLDAFAAGGQGAARVVAVGWGAWRETGMAAARAGDQVDPVLAGAECSEPLDHPFLSRRAAGGVPVFEASIREQDWVADEHRLADGRALLPGSAIVELARAACSIALDGPVELDGVVLRAAAFVDGSTTVRIHVSDDGDASSFVMASQVDGRWTIHATGHARPAPPTPTGRVEAPAAGAREFSSDAPFEPQPGRLHLGPRWGALRRLEVGSSDAAAVLSLPNELASDIGGLGLHPALLDLATGAALSLVAPESGLWVPLGYDKVVSWEKLPAEARVRARRVGEAVHETVRFDIDLADAAGHVVAVVQGLTMRRVDESALAPGRSDRVAGLVSTGIATAEGVDALSRLLAGDLRGPVLVSPMTLEALAAPAPAAATRPAMAAHAGDGAPAEPRDEIEEFLAGQWRDLLGAPAVGLYDDFFDLGGHSLLALRLFARLEKRFGTSLPLATLFEAPTIARLAERVRGGPLVTPGDRSDVSESPPATSAAPTFAYLIRIRAGADGAPFFCVHGAGGNVLNFRDLARGMGDERAMYGLQARGVDGLADPHGTIEEMAEAYLAEVRQVQPEGPYLLGGYSGGGVIAFEMAHQLLRAGQEVAAVVFLDTFLPGIAQPEARSAGERGGNRLRRLLSEGPQYAATWARERYQFERWRLLELRLSLPRAAGRALPISLREVKMTRAFHTAADVYETRPLAVPIVLFTASERPPGLEHIDADLGWKPLAASGLDIRFAAGTHDDLVRQPHVATLAKTLADVLRESLTACGTRLQPAPAHA